ncbi:MAG: hypothetical protein GEV10_27005 [Streptosporangiales bacterium]|nr:hypothetical protein [Streptosporangiales bacterium]
MTRSGVTDADTTARVGEGGAAGVAPAVGPPVAPAAVMRRGVSDPVRVLVEGDRPAGGRETAAAALLGVRVAVVRVVRRVVAGLAPAVVRVARGATIAVARAGATARRAIGVPVAAELAGVDRAVPEAARRVGAAKAVLGAAQVLEGAQGLGAALDHEVGVRRRADAVAERPAVIVDGPPGEATRGGSRVTLLVGAVAAVPPAGREARGAVTAEPITARARGVPVPAARASAEVPAAVPVTVEARERRALAGEAAGPAPVTPTGRTAADAGGSPVADPTAAGAGAIGVHRPAVAGRSAGPEGRNDPAGTIAGVPIPGTGTFGGVRRRTSLPRSRASTPRTCAARSGRSSAHCPRSSPTG